MSSLNVQIAFWLFLFIVGVLLLYGKRSGFKDMGPAIAGALGFYALVVLGFWFVVQGGWWSLGFSSTQVSADDAFVDSFSNIVTSNMLKSNGMSEFDLSDSTSAGPDLNKNDGDHDLPASTGPRSDAAIDPKAAVVEVVWPTPTPEPTPVNYVPTKPRDKMMELWRAWFIKANYNRGKVSTAKIPAGVTCRIKKTSSKGWFSGENIWTMRCFDPNNEDYGEIDINLTEQAKNQLGVSGDDGLVEGTGTWPNGFFVPEGESQSQAPAFAPGPAPAASGKIGPDVFQHIYTHWLHIDAVDGVTCTTVRQQFKLPFGSRYRFDPKVVKDNGAANEIAKVQIVISADGAACWGPLGSGFTHVVQP